MFDLSAWQKKMQEAVTHFEGEMKKVRTGRAHPDMLAEKADKYKDRIIVTHPFHPAHMIPFFEICGGGKMEHDSRRRCRNARRNGRLCRGVA